MFNLDNSIIVPYYPYFRISRVSAKYSSIICCSALCLRWVDRMKIKRAEKLEHLETPSSESRQIIRDFPRNSRCENTIYGLTSTLCIYSWFCHILLFARTVARSFAMPRAWRAVWNVRHFFNVFMGECQSQAGALSRPALGIMLPAGLYIDMMRALSAPTVSLSSEPGGE